MPNPFVHPDWYRRHPEPPTRRRHPWPWPFPEPVPIPIPVPTPTPAPIPAPTPGGAIAWPSFTGTAELAGTSPIEQVSVYYDASLGSVGLAAAQALLAEADNVAGDNNIIFGLAGTNPCNVIVFALGGATDGTGGADHMACDFANGGNIEVDISEGSMPRMAALFEAELSECCMNGQLCGYSQGEALSRWCAITVGAGLNGSVNPLADFVTAPGWVKAGMPDWVSKIEDTDQDGTSIGCGMAFLSWLLTLKSAAGSTVTLPVIAQQMVKDGDNGTLAALYATLTGQPATGAFGAFKTAITALPGGSAGINSDDPWGVLATAIGEA